MASSDQSRGFTLIEFLILVGIVGILALVVASAVSGAESKARRLSCYDNLMHVGRAFSLYAHQNNDHYPMNRLMASNGAAVAAPSEPTVYFKSLTELKSVRSLTCPSDTRKPAASMDTLREENISYFLNLDATPQASKSFLVGDRNLSLNGTRASSRILVVDTPSSLEWSRDIHRSVGNIEKVDGSVILFSTPGLRQALKASREPAVRFMLP